MKIGTKSVLYGAHCFFIHPWFVAAGWWKLYGFPWDPRLWVAFFVHDLGYWGKPNMDGPEGEKHVEWGASVMHRLFDKPFNWKWRDFTMFHSRYYARLGRAHPSRLCFADKMAFILTWTWLYKLQVWMTGEWVEYAAAHDVECGGGGKSLDEWYARTYDYMISWITTHVTGAPDTWTKGHVRNGK